MIKKSSFIYISFISLVFAACKVADCNIDSYRNIIELCSEEISSHGIPSVLNLSAKKEEKIISIIESVVKQNNDKEALDCFFNSHGITNSEVMSKIIFKTIYNVQYTTGNLSQWDDNTLRTSFLKEVKYYSCQESRKKSAHSILNNFDLGEELILKMPMETIVDGNSIIFYSCPDSRDWKEKKIP